ncbi:hypothetical protein FF011L_26300 [Roseimaritima multifibrata]|uniref:Uncharacterized protein n=1 Tax=Roseimaritima multifibrata TaxID=1930274 RepID=A0A517MG37_9BACT|nr:hypothetical protein [Roseimaritima multifibrata]QDS93855.1 hypothetical protein FF011L_26300 [Roseimaritima multifibrata]
MGDPHLETLERNDRCRPPAGIASPSDRMNRFPSSVQDVLERHPVVVVAAVAALGLTVGWIVKRGIR